MKIRAAGHPKGRGRPSLHKCKTRASTLYDPVEIPAASKTVEM
jgi:hypothetical protein